MYEQGLIYEFVEDWLSMEKDGGIYYQPDQYVEFWREALFTWRNVILCEDDAWLPYVPHPTVPISSLIPTPEVIHWNSDEELSPDVVMALEKINIYYIVIRQGADSEYDCLAQAMKIIQRLRQKPVLKFIICYRGPGERDWTIRILKSRNVIAEWKRIEEEQRIYDQPVQREAPLVLIEPDTDGSDAVFTWVQLALAAPFPAELDRSQKILHLYGGQEGSSLIDRINRCRAWQQLPFASLEQRRFICWKDSAREYRAIAMSGIRDNAVGATAIELQVNAVYPGLVIFDFPMIPEDTSPIMKFIQLKRRGGTSFWICSRKRVPFPKFCPSVTLTVSGKEGKHGELFLTAKKTEGSALSGAWLRPLHYSLNTAAIPVSRSKYGAKIPLIRELSMAGVKEVDIAQQLGISHATLKQLKRRHGIRVKAPLQRKRRSGLDKEIFRLFDAGVRPDDIAKKLAITPYYVRLRIQKLSKSMQ